ncbi:Chorismate mutase I / Prephenate dehydratase [hydrothermal vent metagenome]|uniref:Bifunctional chorismate mutase/prephenate dehydratase n=1 Tax=hydrothermal vent metagenome TaxID=652676 RepID=A0A3B0Z166_9ZZZZ
MKDTSVLKDASALQAVRVRIDEIDEKIQALITERARCAEEVARQKGNGPEVVYYRPEREAQVLRAVMARNEGPLDDETMARHFREIMSSCLALQYPMKIAFLGPSGTFTEAAATKHFGNAVTTVPMVAIDDIFREVESGSAHYGVVPVENSIEGVVNHTLDMFMNSPLNIYGEVELRIHHNLMSRSKDLKSIKKLYVHYQAQAQCRGWLDANLPSIDYAVVSSNAEAARCAAEDESAAAIAGEKAAEIYALEILASNIEDEPDNTTRFLVIGNNLAQPSGQDKTSLLVSTVNNPGALHKLLKIFADSDISMTRIESRPSRRDMWDYVFFIDIEGHVQEPVVEQSLQRLQNEGYMVKVLGSYPDAVL